VKRKAAKPQPKIEHGSGGSSGLARIKKIKFKKISENPLDPRHPRSISYARNACLPP